MKKKRVSLRKWPQYLKMARLLCVSLLLTSSFSAVEAANSALPDEAAQPQNEITGYVYDEAGAPVIGAAVVLKGTSVGTITDVQGKFTIRAAVGAELQITFIGYAAQTVRAAHNMTVTLAEGTMALDEVVVVGYGTVKKRDVTGSVTSISSKTLVVS